MFFATNTRQPSTASGVFELEALTNIAISQMRGSQVFSDLVTYTYT